VSSFSRYTGDEKKPRRREEERRRRDETVVNLDQLDHPPEEGKEGTS